MKGFDCYTNFYGMDITKDKLCQLVKKWHSLIEGFVQTKTQDGLTRIFGHYDRNGDGVIDLDEFKQIARELGETMNEEEMRRKCPY